MKQHLKDNHGNMPIWPALIIGALVVIILFLGFVCMFKGINPMTAISDFFNSLWYGIKNLFNPQPVI